jgi:hypothetical protein
LLRAVRREAGVPWFADLVAVLNYQNLHSARE